MLHKKIALRYSTKNEKYFDYCLYPYEPLLPFNGKIKSVNLLICSLNNLVYNNKFLQLIHHIQSEIGYNQTVYGIKNKDNLLSFEFYFYNYYKKNPLLTMTNLIKIFYPFLKFEYIPNEIINYFMVSVDLNEKILQSRLSPGFHIYIPTSEKGNGGYSYLSSNHEYFLENQYEFFDVRTEKNTIIRKIKNSVFIYNSMDLREILIPELFNCWRICVAKKRTSDCIYFSRITVEQLLFFIQKFRYPNQLITFVTKHKDKLSHLLYDVGFDYYTKDDKIIIEKSGFYGIF
jgi:hypothetical protein